MADSKVEYLSVKHRDPLEDAAAIKRCLDYLRNEAERTGLPFAAHLIGVAAEAVSDAITLSTKSAAHSGDGEVGESEKQDDVEMPLRRH